MLDLPLNVFPSNLAWTSLAEGRKLEDLYNSVLNDNTVGNTGVGR